MKRRLGLAVLAGFVGAAIMSIVLYLAPMLGLAEMNAAKMLSGMMHIPIAAGWLLHFMIGIIFALAYALFFLDWVKRIKSGLLRGAIFGLAVFGFAQLMMALMRAMMPEAPAPGGNTAVMMITSLMGHIIYGIPVGQIVTDSTEPVN